MYVVHACLLELAQVGDYPLAEFHVDDPMPQTLYPKLDRGPSQKRIIAYLGPSSSSVLSPYRDHGVDKGRTLKGDLQNG
jgi:hypothetical protein